MKAVVNKNTESQNRDDAQLSERQRKIMSQSGTSRVSLVISVLIIGVLFQFQNCSDVGFTNMDGSLVNKIDHEDGFGFPVIDPDQVVDETLVDRQDLADEDYEEVVMITPDEVKMVERQELVPDVPKELADLPKKYPNHEESPGDDKKEVGGLPVADLPGQSLAQDRNDEKKQEQVQNNGREPSSGKQEERVKDLSQIGAEVCDLEPVAYQAEYQKGRAIKPNPKLKVNDFVGYEQDSIKTQPHSVFIFRGQEAERTLVNNVHVGPHSVLVVCDADLNHVKVQPHGKLVLVGGKINRSAKLKPHSETQLHDAQLATSNVRIAPHAILSVN